MYSRVALTRIQQESEHTTNESATFWASKRVPQLRNPTDHLLKVAFENGATFFNIEQFKWLHGFFLWTAVDKRVHIAQKLIEIAYLVPIFVNYVEDSVA